MAQTNSSSPNPPVGGVSIIILCGLPGSGKTTLSCQLKKHLEEKFGENAKVTHIEFDEVLDEKLLEKDDFTEALSETRQIAISKITDTLKNRPHQQHQHHYLLIDDNMYYRSMRRVLYNLAANYCVSYTQIAVKTPLNVCLERDKGREEGRRVGEEVIKRMEGKMEWPGEEGWEKGSCFFCGEGGDSIEVLLGVIEKDAQNPIVERVEKEKEREKSRAANEKSVMHECDLKLRKTTTELFQQTPLQIKQNKKKMSEMKEFILKMKQIAMNEMKKWINNEQKNDFSVDFVGLEKIETAKEGVEEVVFTMKRVCLREMERIVEN